MNKPPEGFDVELLKRLNELILEVVRIPSELLDEKPKSGEYLRQLDWNNNIRKVMEKPKRGTLRNVD